MPDTARMIRRDRVSHEFSDEAYLVYLQRRVIIITYDSGETVAVMVTVFFCLQLSLL